ncbi:MAG: hypothetical protein O2960_26010 [Verrucomicrobia bacterium]|nr:hypothetical protein [Verrucomicrobiota bacterium]
MNLLPDIFAVFILTHGRPDNVITSKALQKCGYTGKLFFIVDNEDKTADIYRKNFGADRVIVFDKKAEADACDEGNNFDERRTITMARNACFGIAERLGVTHFLELDDDYTDFRFKLPETNNSLFIVKDLDAMLLKFLLFYEASGAISIAFAQNGDFIGGMDAGEDKQGDGRERQGHIRGTRYYRFSKRKCMNSFFCSTERPFRFVGAMNEDVNTYCSEGSRGRLFLTIPSIALNQKQSQSQSGGITEMYLRFGTYCKSFTTVMMMPSSVKVSMLRSNNPRIHHSIDWARTVPCIVRESYRKTVTCGCVDG